MSQSAGETILKGPCDHMIIDGLKRVEGAERLVQEGEKKDLALSR